MISRLPADRDYQVRVPPQLTTPDPALDALALLVSFQFEACRGFLHHMRGEMRARPGFHVRLDDIATFLEQIEAQHRRTGA